MCAGVHCRAVSRRRIVAALPLVVATVAGCATHPLSHAATPPGASATPTSTASSTPSPSVSAAPLDQFGLPIPKPGVQVDPAVVRLGRSVDVDVRREVLRTEQRVDRVLHGRPVHIRVSLDDRYLVYETGVGGVTYPDTRIIINVRPNAPVGTFASLRVWLPFVVAHELDHAVRFTDGPGLIGRMLDYFVSEGLADSFASAMFPDVPASPTDTGLTSAQMRTYWRKAQDILYELPPRQLHDMWLFGSRQTPSNIGYAIGTALIHAVRLHHPRMSWAALTRMASETILGISHFRP